MLKYYLGIFGGHGPNPAAAILCNNKLIAFGEEERFVRIKNANSMLPINSILFCLKSAKISVNDLENISIAWDCKKYAQNQPKFLKKLKSKFDWKDNIYNDLHESKLLTSFNPEIIYVNFPGDLNSDHQVTFKSVFTALRPNSKINTKILRCYEVLSSTDWAANIDEPKFNPDTYVDFTHILKKK